MENSNKNIQSIISVVVPMYNVEEYLTKCLDSLVNQKISSIDIILVDDGSTDKTSNIAKSYADKYSNVSYFYKENGGLSSARNFGLKLAKSQYIAFLDSDDWVDINMYHEMVSVAEKEGADIVSCGTYIVFSDVKIVERKIKKETYDLINKKKYHELTKNFRVAAWDKIYRLDLFLNNQIQYPKGLFFEDTPTIIQLILKAKKISCVEESYYYYLQRNGSITKCDKFDDKYLDIFEGLKYAKKNVINDDIALFILNNFFYRKCILDSIIRMSQFDNVKKAHKLFVVKNIEILKLFSSSIKFSHMLVILMYKVNSNLLLFILKKINHIKSR